MRTFWRSSLLVATAACSSDPADPSNQDGGLPDSGRLSDGGVPSPNRWADLAPLAGGPRQETAVVALNGEIVVIGGFDENGTIGTDVEAYNPTTNTWRSLAPLPVAAHHPNAVAFNGRIYLLGFLTGRFFNEDARSFVYDPATNAWTPRASLPNGRARGSSVVVVVNDQIYVAGGLRLQLAVPDFDRYDPATDTWQALPPLPRGMDHGMGGAIGQRVYVAGGRRVRIATHTDELNVYDVNTAMWTTGPSMPTSRGGGAGAVLDGVLYVIGGEGANQPSGVFDQTEAYDPATNAWRTLAPMTSPRHGTGAAAVGGRIYVPGGATVEGFMAVAVHQAYVP